MRRLLLAFGCMVALTASSAARAQDCFSLAQVIGRQVARIGSDEQLAALQKYQFCSSRYESASSVDKANIEGAYGAISGAASNDATSIKAMQDKVCEGKFSDYWYKKINSTDLETVSDAGAKVIAECIHAKDFRLDNLTMEDQAVSATFSYGGTNGQVINSIEVRPAGIATCGFGMNGNWWDDIKDAPGKEVAHGNSLRVGCTRVGAPVKDDPKGRISYPGGILTVSAQGATVDIPLIPYTVPAISETVAEALQKTVDQQQTTIATLGDKLAALTKRLEGSHLATVDWPSGPFSGSYLMAPAGHDTSYGTCPDGSVAFQFVANVTGSSVITGFRCLKVQLVVPPQ